MFQQHIVGYGVLLAVFAHVVHIDAVFNIFLYFILSSWAVNDQASIQASGLWSGGREGHPGARLLQTHRLGTPREQGDTASVQTQSGTWALHVSCHNTHTEVMLIGCCSAAHLNSQISWAGLTAAHNSSSIFTATFIQLNRWAHLQTNLLCQEMFTYTHTPPLRTTKLTHRVN